ncbi:hypothetical protein HZS_2523 [Henneguya salminicola]|nr:hypothetical protein HZS_2523 [Henneguya salminicola]
MKMRKSNIRKYMEIFKIYMITGKGKNKFDRLMENQTKFIQYLIKANSKLKINNIGFYIKILLNEKYLPLYETVEFVVLILQQKSVIDIKPQIIKLYHENIESLIRNSTSMTKLFITNSFVCDKIYIIKNDYHEIYFNDIIEWMWEETVNELKITIAYNNILMLQDTLNLIVTKDIDFVISYMENAMWVKYCRQSHSCIFKTKTSSSIVKQPIKSELYKTLDCDKQNTSPEIDYLLSPNIFPYQRKADDGLSESNLYSL